MAVGLVAPDGRILRRYTVPTRGEAPGPDGLWRVLAAPLSQVLSEVGGEVEGAGIGCAGPVDVRQGTVSPVNITVWQDYPLVARVAGLVGDLPVRLAGDAVCAVVGEHWQGSGVGLPDLLGVVVSTGVGGGVIAGGKLVWGSGNAGHLGHTVVDLDGDPCACGGTGCVETVASGPHMVAWALGQGWQALPELGRTGGVDVVSPTAASDPAPIVQPSAATLAVSARAGNAVALAAFERAGRALAASIASAAALLDITHVVVGGGVSRSADLLLPPVHAGLERYGRLKFLRSIEVRAARLPDVAGLLGAAALVHAPHAYLP
jgi:glucokinase